MTELEFTIGNLEAAGRSITLDALGGLDVVLDSGFQISPALGPIVAALAREWDRLGDRERVIGQIAEGLRRNPDRLALREAVDVLQGLPLATWRSFVVALEGRTREDEEHPLLQAEAAAGIARFALADRRWKSSAIAALHAYRPGRDDQADPMYCRLISLAHDFFEFAEASQLLDEYATFRTSAVEARLERGLVELSLALGGSSVGDIEERLHEAEHWLEKAVEADSERRDTRSYYLLIRSMLSVHDPERTDLNELVEALKGEALIGDLWDRAAPGMEWLRAPDYALAAWVPVVESLTHVAGRLREPSWLDAPSVLNHVYVLYGVNRSVRSGSPSLGEYLRPIIEGAFVRERGLAAHLEQWLATAPPNSFKRAEAERLRANIARFVAEDPPKNSKGWRAQPKRHPDRANRRALARDLGLGGATWARVLDEDGLHARPEPPIFMHRAKAAERRGVQRRDKGAFRPTYHAADQVSYRPH